MPGSWQFWCWKLLSFLVMGGVLASSGDCARTQIAPDATMGAESSVVTPNVEINGIPSDRIDGGAVRGANLFHSFREFNVGAGRGAYFANPDAIQNILGRVTGGNPSHILGRLGVLGNANLFLLNPNGIIFGPSASLDIGGSFVGSTASSLNFADGTQFSATAPQTTPLLTISVPLGLQYGENAGSIQYQSRANNIETGEIGGLLDVQPGKTLALVGGNVSLSGGNLYAPGGRIELGGLAEPGTVGLQVNGNSLSLSYPEVEQRADVSLTNGVEVDVKADVGGSIAINARSLDILAGSTLFAGIGEGLGSVDSQAGDITLNATGTITVAGSNNDRSGILNTVSAGAEGKSGNINIQARSLDVTDGTLVFTDTFGQGDAGSIFVRVDDSVSLANSSISSYVQSGAVGKGGNIDIQARSLSLTNGATLLSGTSGRGDAGSVSIQASESVSFVNSRILNENIGDFDADGEVAVGKAGDINIQTGSLSLSNGAGLATFTSGLGDAGSVFIRASGHVSFTSGSNILTNVAEREAEGNGSDITILAQSLSLDDTVLATGTFGQGNAGSVFVQTNDSVSLTNSSSISSFVGPEAVGKGGDINITARSLSLREDSSLVTANLGQAGEIVRADAGNIQVNVSDSVSVSGGSLRSDTFGEGDAGNVTIEGRDGVVPVVSFDGVASQVRSTVGRELISGVVRVGNGKGGDIIIRARSLSLTNGAQLFTSTFGQGNAGNVRIDAGDITLAGGNNSFSAVRSNVESGAVGNGGEIDITASSLSLTDGAQIQTLVRQASEDGLPAGRGNAGTININVSDAVTLAGMNNGFPSAVFSSLGLGAEGKGGDIKITAGSLSLIDGVLDASTSGQGNAGNIFVNVRDTLQANDSTISTAATQFAGGTIDITAGNIFLSGDSDIRTDVASGAENGGNINLTADSVIAFDDSDILAFAEDGRGGNITLNTPAFFGAGYVSAPSGTDPDSLDGNNRVDVNASGAVAAGSITIPDTTFLQNSFIDLPENPVDTNTLVVNSCVTRSARQKGSFIVTGADGFQHRPGDAFISPYPTGTVRPIPSDNTSSNPPSSVSNLRPTRPWQIGDPIVEAQGVYRLADGQLVLSRECSN